MRTNVAGADNIVLQEAISALTDEAYTTARKLSGTGIVGSNPQINRDTETYIGQVRWNKPLNPTINVASLTNATAGATTTFAQDYLTYVKTVRTHGAEKVNMQQVVTQQDGLARISRDFGETQAQGEHNSILSVMKGVAKAEATYGTGTGGLGGQSFDNNPDSKNYGFYVDLGANKAVVDSTATVQGAARAEGFLRAFGMAYKDYEPEYAYLVTSPEVMASLRSANLVDQTTVSDGNVNFQTIFGGKFRLIQTRASQGFSSAELTALNTGSGVDILGTKTSFIVLPGAIAMENLMVPDTVEIQRDAKAYAGGGTTSIWYRWGYVMAPAGYNWTGSADAFASDANYAAGTWDRKFSSALSLGILPVFHA